MLIQDRVKLIIKANNLSSSEFADQIGIKRSNLSHVLNGRNKPGLEFLSKVINAFPNVNASWLLTGKQRQGILQEESVDKGIHSTNTIESSREANTDKIDKIVVFYTDGSFKDYSPSA